MKKTLKCLSVIIVMLTILFNFSITALAQTTTQDGLQVNLTTDKQSYSLNEDIKITVSVTNTNDFTVKDVSIEALLPDKFELKDSNDETSTKAIDLKSGEQANLIVVAVVKGEEQNVTKPTENTVEPSTVSDDTTEPTTKSTESNADNTQNTKPNTQTTTSSISNNDNNNSDKSDDNTKNNNNQDNTSIKTGSDYIYMGIFIVLLLASISTLLYCLIKHFNKTTKIISSILCVVIAVTSVVGISKFNAFAQENTTTITLNEHIKVDNCDYTISANVDYVSVSKEKWFKDVEENHIVKSDTGEEYIDNRIIVLFTPETTEEQKQNVVKFVNGEIIGNDDGSKYQIQIETTENLEELEEICLSVSRMPGVLWCFYETVYEVSKATEQLKAVPNDPWKDTFQGIWGTDWNEENPGGLNWWLETIQAPSAWDYNNRFNSIKIGVVDNGFDIDHEDLKINLINPNENSSDKNKKNHGTHVAGIIGATANNEKGITGIVWNKDLYCADVVATKKQENEHISILNSIDGIEETLKKGCKIVNLSIGDNLNNNADRILKNGRNTTALLLYWDRYIKDDFIIVQSAGNEKTDCTNNGSFSSITRESIDYVFDNQDEIWPGLDISFREEYSADDIYKHIIIVGATDKPSSKNEYKLTDFSNYGDNISIVAPGKDIFSTIYSGGINGNYGYNDGTSMAAPIVSGVTALVWSVNPNFTSDEVKNIVCNSYNKTANGYVKSDNRAYPIVNAKFAVEEAIRRTDNKGVATGAFVDIKTKVHVKDVTMKCIRYTGELSGYALSDFDIKTVDGIFYQELYEGTYEYKIEANDYTLDRTVIIVVRKGKTTDKGTIELISTTGSVCAGIVKDSKTNNPIKDVRVEVIDNSSDSLDPVATTTTDENGNFSLNLPYGSYSLSFHHDNYNYYGTSLEVDSEYVILQNPVLLNPTTSENLIQNNDIVTLTGILKTEDYEINSNNKGTVTILDLDNPIKCYLKDGNNYDGKTEYNIKSVQISSPDLKEYIGQNVTVKGKVMLAHTAHHRRDVVLLESEVIKSGDDNVKFAGGDGTETNPYQVSTPEQLNAVRNDLSAHYVQINDIDMSSWGNWEPIGTVVPHYRGVSVSSESLYFTGIYNGNNYKISNLKIYNNAYSPTTDCYGLFAGISLGKVINVNLSNINYEIIKNSEDYEYSPKNMTGFSVCVGGLVGRLDENGEIAKCSVSGKISVVGSYYDYVGGIVGYGNASHCKNYTNISVVSDSGNSSDGVYCGGISGSSIYREDEFLYCKNYGNIDVSCVTFVYCGGIVGEHGCIKFSENYGDIVGKSTLASWSTSFAGNCNVGGIVGATFTNTPINCINYGNISSYCNNNNVGSGYAGGIAGFNGYKDYGNLENNYNYGKAIISQGLNGDKLKKGGAGRIAGYSIKTNSCYSINSTTVNGSIPTENIAPNAINGGSLTKKEMDEKVKDLV